MAKVGIYIETADGKVKRSSLEAITLAREAGNEIYVIVFESVQEEMKKVFGDYGVKEIIQVNGVPEFNYDTYADCLKKISDKYSLEYLLGAFSAHGKELLPRVAVLKDGVYASDITGFDFSEAVAIKPFYAGKVIARIRLKGDFRVLTIRPNVISANVAGNPTVPVLSSFDASVESPLVQIKEVIKSLAKKIELTEAEIIVSGGRGVKSRENFKIIEELAAELGAAVGASRGAVDAGYADPDMQVGQTGKTVNPKLYIACGISGAIQHLAGMKTSKIIVAINKDPEAPIFKVADYGIVGDLFEVIPILKEELKRLLQK